MFTKELRKTTGNEKSGGGNVWLPATQGVMSLWNSSQKFFQFFQVFSITIIPSVGTKSSLQGRGCRVKFFEKWKGNHLFAHQKQPFTIK